VAQCCSCSASLPPNTIQCEYCGSRNDIDLNGIHYNTTNELDSPRSCPRCNITLKTIDLEVNGKFLIERCDQCLGLFFDPNELEALLEAMVSNVFGINRSEIENINKSLRACDYTVTYVKCPICSKMMNRVNFGAKSGVIVDRCKDHGVWLDGGELRHLFEWMKAGGKLLDQEMREQQKEEAKREERQRQWTQQGTPCVNRDYSDFDSYGGTLRHQDPDLFDLVRCALDFFVR